MRSLFFLEFFLYLLIALFQYPCGVRPQCPGQPPFFAFAAVGYRPSTCIAAAGDQAAHLRELRHIFQRTFQNAVYRFFPESTFPLQIAYGRHRRHRHHCPMVRW